MTRITTALLIIGFLILHACNKKPAETATNDIQQQDSVKVEKEEVKKIDTVIVEKDLLYDKYTLEDTYPYKDTTRSFKWEKIRAGLRLLDSVQQQPAMWGVLQNYRNNNGEASLVKEYKRNVYKRIADNYGVERFQGVPLFALEDTITAERYGRDGSLVKITQQADSTDKFVKLETVYISGEWFVPKKYVKEIHDSLSFTHAIFVDRVNENIMTLEKKDDKWLVRSMNPATTGLHNPPYQQETPLGMFVIQEKKSKMYFLVDGTTRNGGFAPYANRFTNGGYIHGVPVNAPRTALIEYSASLGTTPRSHMCVRNATSHAKFVYDNFPVEATIVFIIE
ncbi:L,D-transpeptidase [Prevotella sp. 10(H)]|uniref:L,D-transpeptidase n=1 Tax=Prevotella sp. 10(H) TaxID=1158294 RepID=UPI0004A72A8C|nr:L,D-transpeptidase [Prevotella sp. 10(H)]